MTLKKNLALRIDDGFYAKSEEYLNINQEFVVQNLVNNLNEKNTNNISISFLGTSVGTGKSRMALVAMVSKLVDDGWLTTENNSGAIFIIIPPDIIVTWVEQLKKFTENSQEIISNLSRNLTFGIMKDRNNFKKSDDHDIVLVPSDLFNISPKESLLEGLRPLTVNAQIFVKFTLGNYVCDSYPSYGKKYTDCTKKAAHIRAQLSTLEAKINTAFKKNISGLDVGFDGYDFQWFRNRISKIIVDNQYKPIQGVSELIANNQDRINEGNSDYFLSMAEILDNEYNNLSNWIDLFEDDKPKLHELKDHYFKILYTLCLGFKYDRGLNKQNIAGIIVDEVDKYTEKDKEHRFVNIPFRLGCFLKYVGFNGAPMLYVSATPGKSFKILKDVFLGKLADISHIVNQDNIPVHKENNVLMRTPLVVEHSDAHLFSAIQKVTQEFFLDTNGPNRSFQRDIKHTPFSFNMIAFPIGFESSKRDPIFLRQYNALEKEYSNAVNKIKSNDDGNKLLDHIIDEVLNEHFLRIVEEKTVEKKVLQVKNKYLRIWLKDGKNCEDVLNSPGKNPERELSQVMKELAKCLIKFPLDYGYQPAINESSVLQATGMSLMNSLIELNRYNREFSVQKKEMLDVFFNKSFSEKLSHEIEELENNLNEYQNDLAKLKYLYIYMDEKHFFIKLLNTKDTLLTNKRVASIVKEFVFTSHPTDRRKSDLRNQCIQAIEKHILNTSARIILMNKIYKQITRDVEIELCKRVKGMAKKVLVKNGIYGKDKARDDEFNQLLKSDEIVNRQTGQLNGWFWSKYEKLLTSDEKTIELKAQLEQMLQERLLYNMMPKMTLAGTTRVTLGPSSKLYSQGGSEDALVEMLRHFCYQNKMNDYSTLIFLPSNNESRRLKFQLEHPLFQNAPDLSEIIANINKINQGVGPYIIEKIFSFLNGTSHVAKLLTIRIIDNLQKKKMESAIDKAKPGTVFISSASLTHGTNIIAAKSNLDIVVFSNRASRERINISQILGRLGRGQDYLQCIYFFYLKLSYPESIITTDTKNKRSLTLPSLAFMDKLKREIEENNAPETILQSSASNFKLKQNVSTEENLSHFNRSVEKTPLVNIIRKDMAFFKHPDIQSIIKRTASLKSIEKNTNIEQYQINQEVLPLPHITLKDVQEVQDNWGENVFETPSFVIESRKKKNHILPVSRKRKRIPNTYTLAKVYDDGARFV